MLRQRWLPQSRGPKRRRRLRRTGNASAEEWSHFRQSARSAAPMGAGSTTSRLAKGSTSGKVSSCALLTVPIPSGYGPLATATNRERCRSHGCFRRSYLVVGVVIASSHHYFEHASTLKPLLSALRAIVLCPLLLVGINLHIK